MHRPFKITITLVSLLSVLVLAGTARAEAVRWLDFEAGLAQARKEKKPVLVDFNTAWCRDCKKMDKTTFADAKVAAKLAANFVTVKVDGEKRKDLASRYQVFAYPTFWVLDSGGGKLNQRIGYMPPEEFGAYMDYVLSGSYKTTGFQGYLKNRR